MSDTATEEKPAKEIEPKSRGFEDFFTKDAANEGVKVPLYWPDGKKSDFWLLVAGVDSDVYIKAKTKLDRFAMTAYKGLNDDEAQDIHLGKVNELKAACVIDWKMQDNDGNDVACTFENVVNLLDKAPQLVKQIDDIIYDRSQFIKKKSLN